MRPAASEFEAAALQQPGAVRRGHGIKFRCPACAAEGHDEHRDNACLFNTGDWGCAWSKETDLGRAHWEAIGRALGALSNGHTHGAQAPSAPPTSGDGLDLVPLSVLLGEPAEVYAWVVKERLPAGGLGLLVGKPKAGKSTLARCLALAVARGAPWLGFETRPGPVIYLALEEKRAEVREHFRSLGATVADQILLLCASAPLDALERLRREAERRRPVLIIIDPLFRFVRVKDGNDYATMTAALEPLLVLARETGACVVLVHHMGKGERGDGDNVLGSTAIFGAVDSALLMKRTEKYRTLSSIQRYGEDLEEITITLDPDTRNVSGGAPRAQAEENDAARLILNFLETAPAPVTEAELDVGIECRTQPRRAALRALVAKGEVLRTGRGGKADPFRYAGTRIAAGASL
jgi:AAA domain